MANVDLTVDSDVPAAAVLAAATDFTDRRPALWPTIEPAVYEVHAMGPTWAEVTEGSRFLGLIWARERYEWSTPGAVRATVLESNVFRAGGTWELAATDDQGPTRIRVRSRRQARGLRGRILGAMLAIAGRQVLAGNLDQTLRLLAADGRAAGAAAR